MPASYNKLDVSKLFANDTNEEIEYVEMGENEETGNGESQSEEKAEESTAANEADWQQPQKSKWDADNRKLIVIIYFIV